MTLRLRLAVAGAVVMIVFLAAGLVIVQVVTRAQLREVDQQLVEALPPARVLAHHLSRFSGPALPKGFSQRLTTAERFSAVYVAAISSSGRHVVVGHDIHGQGPLLPTVVSSSSSPMPTIQTVSSAGGAERWRATLFRQPGGGELLVAVSLSGVDASDSQLRLTLVLAGAIIALVAAALWWWVVRLGLHPIAEVTRVADAITTGDRSRRVRESRRGKEAAHLSRAFNVMLDEEQAAEDRLRRFVADASHELRTPVSVIQGFSELWRSGVLDAEGNLDDAMRRIGQESHRLGVLVDDLLLLARLDEGVPLDQAPVDLSCLAREVADRFLSMHPDRHVVIDIDDGVVVEGDGTRLRQVLDNLVRNAVVHTQRGVTIEMSLHRDGDRVLLEVKDDGQGMDDAQSARAFERFWRGNPSRSGPGTGLGLSIVSSVVAAHGGAVTLQSARGSGLAVRVVLSCCAAPAPEGQARRV